MAAERVAPVATGPGDAVEEHVAVPLPDAAHPPLEPEVDAVPTPSPIEPKFLIINSVHYEDETGPTTAHAGTVVSYLPHESLPWLLQVGHAVAVHDLPEESVLRLQAERMAGVVLAEQKAAAQAQEEQDRAARAFAQAKENLATLEETATMRSAQRRAYLEAELARLVKAEAEKAATEKASA